jgi:hypothetical protein
MWRISREKSRKRCSRARRMLLESLETRSLLAADVTAILTDGVLRIEGTPGNDQIVVRQVGNSVQVDGVKVTGADGSPVDAPVVGIGSVRVDALDGNDLIWITGDWNIDVDVRGGAGADLLLAGPKTRLHVADLTPLDAMVDTGKGGIWQQLEAATRSDNGEYRLDNLSLNGVTLTNALMSLHDGGVAVGGNADLPIFGEVRFGGAVTENGGYSLHASRENVSLWGGLLQISSAELDLTPDGVSVVAKATVANIGNVTFRGMIHPDGSYSLGAKASVDIAGFKVDGAQLTLGDNALQLAMRIPVPAIGDVEFSGSYGPTGWSLKGTYPGIVTIGPVVLKQISVEVATDQVSGDRLTLEALGTIASIDGIVNARATATVFNDGRFNMNVDARAVQVGSFSLGNAVVTLRNDNAERLVITTLQGVVGVPGGPNVKLEGVIDAAGNYSLSGSESFRVVGLTLSRAKFTLTKDSGMTFRADMNYGVYKVAVTGVVTSQGHMKFSGSGGTARLPNGFKLSKVSVHADLNRPAETYTLHVKAVTQVLGVTLEFSGHSVSKGGDLTAPTLTAHGKVGGRLSSLFAGNADFTMESKAVRFEGRFKNPLGKHVNAKGAIYANGKITTNYGTVSADPRDLASVLSRMGADPRQIANVLHKQKFTAGSIADALHGRLKIGHSRVADALYHGGVTKDLGKLAKLFGQKGLNSKQIAETLRQGLKVSSSEIANALYHGGVTRDPRKIAEALRTVGANPKDVASALKPLKFNSSQIDDALRNGAKFSASQVGDALKSTGIKVTLSKPKVKIKF